MTRRHFAGDIVYTQIKKQIIELEYGPELSLNEEMLTSDLGVSRTPLRQALLRLELEGLIVRRSNGRMHVAPVSIEEAEEIFKVREVLEGLIVREAAKNINDSQISRLEDTLQLMLRSAHNDRRIDSIRYGSHFHHILYEPSGNHTAVQFLEQLNSRLERYRRLGGYKNPKYAPLLPVQEHQDILSAIKNSDAGLAEQLMRAHIRRTLGVTKETLKFILHRADI